MKKYKLMKCVDGEWWPEGAWSEEHIASLARAAARLGAQGFDPEDISVVEVE